MKPKDFAAVVSGAGGERLALAGRAALWVRGPASFDGDWIALDRKRVEVYPFLQAEDVLDDLLAVGTPDDALAFVARFGLLTKGPGTVPEQPSDTDVRERWSEWRQHIFVLRGIAELYMQLRDAVRGDAAAMLLLRESAPKVAAALKVKAPTSDDELLPFASEVIATWLTSLLKNGTQSVEASVFWADPAAGMSADRFFFGFAPRDLIGWAYYQLAVYIVDAVPVRICEGCGRLFMPTDMRQIYHDARCASRVRQRRLREGPSRSTRPKRRRRKAR